LPGLTDRVPRLRTSTEPKFDNGPAVHPTRIVSMKDFLASASYRVTCARYLPIGEANLGTEIVHRAGQQVTSSTSLDPFALRALPRFLATMGPLTPEPPALRTGRFPIGNPALERRPIGRSGLPALCVWPSDHSVSNHLGGSGIAFARYPSASRTSGLLRIQASPFPSRLAAPSKAESSSLTLRTGRSPPVASHPLSRGRSYVQLQAGERLPEEDFHLSDQTHLQAH